MAVCVSLSLQGFQDLEDLSEVQKAETMVLPVISREKVKPG